MAWLSAASHTLHVRCARLQGGLFTKLEQIEQQAHGQVRRGRVWNRAGIQRWPAQQPAPERQPALPCGVQGNEVEVEMGPGEVTLRVHDSGVITITKVSGAQACG